MSVISVMLVPDLKDRKKTRSLKAHQLKVSSMCRQMSCVVQYYRMLFTHDYKKFSFPDQRPVTYIIQSKCDNLCHGCSRPVCSHQGGFDVTGV